MKQIQVRDFSDDIRPGDHFGTNLALSLIDGQMDNHATRLEVATLLLNYIDSVVDCSGQEKRKYNPQTEDALLFDALVTVASVMPAEEMEKQFEIAARMENFLYLDMEPAHQDNNSKFLQYFQNKIDLENYHTRNNQVKAENERRAGIRAFNSPVVMTSQDTALQMDYDFWDTPTAAVCDVYKSSAGSRDVKRKLAMEFI